LKAPERKSAPKPSGTAGGPAGGARGAEGVGDGGGADVKFSRGAKSTPHQTPPGLVPGDGDGSHAAAMDGGLRKSSRSIVKEIRSKSEMAREARKAKPAPRRHVPTDPVKALTQAEILAEAATTEVRNLADLERMLRMEEATKKKAERVKTHFNGAVIRIKSSGPVTTMELRFGARLPPPLGAKAPKATPAARCVVTGKPAKYRDPLTGQPYLDASAFKELRRRREVGGGSGGIVGGAGLEGGSGPEGRSGGGAVNDEGGGGHRTHNDEGRVTSSPFFTAAATTGGVACAGAWGAAGGAPASSDREDVVAHGQYSHGTGGASGIGVGGGGHSVARAVGGDSDANVAGGGFVSGGSGGTTVGGSRGSMVAAAGVQGGSQVETGACRAGAWVGASDGEELVGVGVGSRAAPSGPYGQPDTSTLSRSEVAAEPKAKKLKKEMSLNDHIMSQLQETPMVDTATASMAEEMMSDEWCVHD